MAVTRADWDLRLLGFWQLGLHGQIVNVGSRQQRLIAALALLGARPRHVLAGVLWPESSEEQAATSLRAVLFRISHDLPQLLADSRDPVALNVGVRTDLDRVRRLIDDISHPGSEPAHDAFEILRTAELLPGWYDDWVLFEQERLQQQRLTALESLAMHYLAQGDHIRALEAARGSAMRCSGHCLFLSIAPVQDRSLNPVSALCRRDPGLRRGDARHWQARHSS